MLSLHSDTSERWLRQVDAHLDEVLIDHAHCEKKAAGAAMKLIFSYVEHEAFCRELSVIVVEELDHFRQVLDLLARRGIRWRKQVPSNYGEKLSELIRKGEPAKAIDRLLIAGLIEARSCERFDLLRRHVRDPELAAFYDSLFESEARHHSTYVQLAGTFGDPEEIRARLHELAERETEIVAIGDELPRMHS